MATHTCPGRCGRDNIPAHLYACPQCWHSLPAGIQERISTNYRSNPAEHLRAMADAGQWFRDNRPVRGTVVFTTGTDDESNAEITPTADLALFARRAGRLFLVAVVRGWPPHKGKKALPGGYLKPRERFEAAARREFAEETGLTAPEQLYVIGVYDDPERDPRGHVVSVAYLGYLGEVDELPAVKGGDDADSAFWLELDDNNPAGTGGFAFDHEQIVRAALAHKVMHVACAACGQDARSKDPLVPVPYGPSIRLIHRSHLADDATTGLFGACP